MPITRYPPYRWLRACEKLAGLEPQVGSLWHAFRRAWATSRKHMPDADVAAVGGWTGTQALKLCYQHADMATMIAVAEGGIDIREAK